VESIRSWRTMWPTFLWQNNKFQTVGRINYDAIFDKLNNNEKMHGYFMQYNTAARTFYKCISWSFWWTSTKSRFMVHLLSKCKILWSNKKVYVNNPHLLQELYETMHRKVLLLQNDNFAVSTTSVQDVRPTEKQVGILRPYVKVQHFILYSSTILFP
jgi:hypothetical protein